MLIMTIILMLLFIWAPVLDTEEERRGEGKEDCEILEVSQIFLSDYRTGT